MRNRSPLKATRLHERKRRKLIFSISLVLIAVGIVLGTTSWLAHWSKITIQNVEVTGNAAIDASDIKGVIDTHLNDSYFWLYPHRNRFIYPNQAIKTDLMTTFPRLSQADLKVQGQTLEVSVVERQPAFVWCDYPPRVGDNSNRSCYFIDTTGYVFSPAPVFSGNAYYQFSGPLNREGSSTPLGAAFLDPAAFKALNDFIQSLDRVGIKTFAFDAEPEGVRVLYLTNGGRLLFTDIQDYQALLTNCAALLQQTNIFKPGSNLDYIDLRFGNKVYYKSKQ